MEENRKNQENPAIPSRSQVMFSLLYSMVPLIGFWLIEKYWGLEAGVIAAVILALAEVLWVYVKEKRLEPFATWSAVLVVSMGAISWIAESNTILRLKPAIFEGFFGFLLLFSSIVKKPFMLIAARKHFGENGVHPLQRDYLGGVNLRIAFLFLAHGAMIVYAALYLSMDAWAFVSNVLFYVLIGIFFGFEFVYARFVMRKKMENLAKERAFLEYQKNMIAQVRKKRM